MKNTRLVQPLGKEHKQALDVLRTLNTRAGEVGDQLEALRVKRAEAIEKHAQKEADSLMGGKGTLAGGPDTSNIDAQIEALEATQKELARRWRAEADAEIAARLRGLDGAIKAEAKDRAGIELQISDHEQAILKLKAELEPSQARQADLAEQVKDAEVLASGARVVVLMGSLDALAELIESPEHNIDRVAAYKALRGWQAGVVGLDAIPSGGPHPNYRAVQVKVLRAYICYDRLTGKVLDGNIDHATRLDGGPWDNKGDVGPELTRRAFEAQLQFESFKEEQFDATQ